MQEGYGTSPGCAGNRPSPLVRFLRGTHVARCGNDYKHAIDGSGKGLMPRDSPGGLWLMTSPPGHMTAFFLLTTNQHGDQRNEQEPWSIQNRALAPAVLGTAPRSSAVTPALSPQTLQPARQPKQELDLLKP